MRSRLLRWPPQLGLECLEREVGVIGHRPVRVHLMMSTQHGVELPRQSPVIVIGKLYEGDPDLLEIADALSAFGPALGLGKCGQKDGGQDADDGDDHQQLDEREPAPPAG